MPVERSEPASQLPGAGDPDDPGFTYDELGLFAENCAEYDLAHDPPVEVERISVPTPDGHDVAALRWGSGAAEAVFVHGGAQNAHTWDTVALAMRPTPVLAVDLPGHGRSSWHPEARYDPRTNAEALAAALDGWLDGPVPVVGMSLGGLSAMALGAIRPDLLSALVLVDITPGVTRDKAREVHDFIAGPQSFASFSEIFDRTVEFNPTRSASSLRRGILHNAHRRSDGSWQWNYDRTVPDGDGFPDPVSLWDDISAGTVPLMLVRGAESPVVDDDDVEELLRRRPDAEVVVVEGAGHSVQGDRPLELVRILSNFLG